MATTTNRFLVAGGTSVNYHFSRLCNYKCKFCFHTAKTSTRLSLEDAKEGIRLLKEAGIGKINFAGGEPFLHARYLGELCKYSHDAGLAVSIISNGSQITDKWMKAYGEYVDILGVSIDSFDAQTNIAIGRGTSSAAATDKNPQSDIAFCVRDLCEQHGIQFKINSVVCSLNHEEDMTEPIQQLDPMRWKVFQVLILGNENAGGQNDLLNAQDLRVSDDQFSAFIARHQSACPQLVPEPNNVMQNSYLLLDEEMRFLDSSSGCKVPSPSILDVGVERALDHSGFDPDMFVKRGGSFDWFRKRSKTPFSNP